MDSDRPHALKRLFRGETSFDFVGRWRRWMAISGLVIVVGVASLGLRGLNFSIEFKGGSVWTAIVAPNVTVAQARAAVNAAVPGMGQATVQSLTSLTRNQHEIQVQAGNNLARTGAQLNAVTEALQRISLPGQTVTEEHIGPSWGSDITDKAIEAVIIFLVVVTAYIWLRFEGKMAIAALVALLHDLVVTAGIYSLSGFQVSPDTVVAFLTILGYSLYDTIVVFDRVQENTRGLSSTNRMTYSDTVNLSMNQVLARSLNTSLVAIMPILSILVIGAGVLGATALEDFGLALFIGLTTGAYSSIFIASPLLALMKEREPRYAEIRRRLAQAKPRRLTPAAAAVAADLPDRWMDPEPVDAADRGSAGGDRRAADELPGEVELGAPPAGAVPSGAGLGAVPLRSPVAPRSTNRPPPRPRKKGRRR